MTEYKPGDKVYVNWPTGKDGPWEISDVGTLYMAIIHGEGAGQMKVNVPRAWLEPAEPEIKNGRLCYFWDVESQKSTYARPYGKHTIEGHQDAGRFLTWAHARPVHRRWEELAVEEQSKFIDVVYYGRGQGVFSEAYKLITGEKHP